MNDWNARYEKWIIGIKCARIAPISKDNCPSFDLPFFQIFPRVDKQDSYQLLTCRKLNIFNDRQKKFAPII